MSFLNLDEKAVVEPKLPSKIPAMLVAVVAWVILLGMWRVFGIRGVVVSLLDGVAVMLAYHMFRRWQVKRFIESD